jgi:hypothetical protein
VFINDIAGKKGELEYNPKVNGKIWALENISRTYAIFERMHEIIGEPFNSQRLDYGLASGNWDEWNSASIDYLLNNEEFAQKFVKKFKANKEDDR